MLSLGVNRFVLDHLLVSINCIHAIWNLLWIVEEPIADGPNLIDVVWTPYRIPPRPSIIRVKDYFEVSLNNPFPVRIEKSAPFVDLVNVDRAEQKLLIVRA